MAKKTDRAGGLSGAARIVDTCTDRCPRKIVAAHRGGKAKALRIPGAAGEIRAIRERRMAAAASATPSVTVVQREPIIARCQIQACLPFSRRPAACRKRDESAK